MTDRLRIIGIALLAALVFVVFVGGVCALATWIGGG